MADQTPEHRLALYVVPVQPDPVDHVRFALQSLTQLAEHVVVICPKELTTALVGLGDGRVTVIALHGPSTVAAGYKQGLQWIWDQGLQPGHVILTGSHVIGPLLPIDPRAFDLAAHDADLFAAYWHNAALDGRLAGVTKIARLPYLDFAVVSARLMAEPGFRAFWAGFRPTDDFWEEILRLTLGLAEQLHAGGHKVIYPVGFEALETSDPRLYEVHKLVSLNLPCIPIAALRLDPVLHDLYAIDLRFALDDMRLRHPDLYAVAIRYILRNLPPRDFAMIADQYEVVPLTARSPNKSTWAFGTVALFIHVFYAEMMPEFWALIARFPGAVDLYITTSTARHKSDIEAFLAAKNLPASAFHVEVVACNRGRDMSSLFITFRDVVLSGKYDVALRLHSKRTPQVARQVGENFKKHLFENLAAGPGYISNILDRFESETDIGMIMAPVVHIGFGTLGHSWFNNRAPLLRLSETMGLKVRLDPDTPLAPLGTMYWFRCAALAKMFEHPWTWEDYNAEPHHVDGGLAHVQERLICYCCVDQGFRVLMAMTPDQAARNYAKLEYKLQLLAARLNTGNILSQRDQLDNISVRLGSILFRNLFWLYGATIRRYPALRKPLKPAVKVARFFFQSRHGT